MRLGKCWLQFCHRFQARRTNTIIYLDWLQATYTHFNKTLLRERKPMLTLKFQPKAIQDSNPDSLINPDLDSDVCQISPKMLWIHYLVRISRFATFCKNRAATVSEMLINILKFPLLQWWGKWKTDPEPVSGTGAPPKVNQFFQLVDSIIKKVKVKVWTLAIAPLIWVRLVTSSALQSRKWQLIGMSQWCRSALCGHPLPALTDNWTHGTASRHTIAPISHTRPSPRSHSYYSFPVPQRVGGWVGLSTQ